MTKTKRPAEQLAEEIGTVLKTYSAIMVGRKPLFVMVPADKLRDWLKLSKSIDARMRLDGSRLNRKKSAGAGRKRVTR